MEWWACPDLNREPKHYECSALTIELQARRVMFAEAAGNFNSGTTGFSIPVGVFTSGMSNGLLFWFGDSDDKRAGNAAFVFIRKAQIDFSGYSPVFRLAELEFQAIVG